MGVVGSRRRVLSKRVQGHMGVSMNPLEPMWRADPGQGDQGGGRCASPEKVQEA